MLRQGNETISLLSITGKPLPNYCSFTYQPLRKWSPTIPESQCGFQAGKETVDMVDTIASRHASTAGEMPRTVSRPFTPRDTCRWSGHVYRWVGHVHRMSDM